MDADRTPSPHADDTGDGSLTADSGGLRAPGERPWGHLRHFAFRFVFLYFLLACVPALLEWLPTVLLEMIPGSEPVLEKLDPNWLERKAWHEVTPWVGANVLSLDREVDPHGGGSGDTMHEYVKLFTIVAGSLLLALIWSVLDRRRRRPFLLPRTLHLSARYYLAFWMILYGSFKVIKLQFPFPGPMYMTATYGESSPMRLLWFFMGYSESYTIFAGAAEVLGGLLLLFRRTTTLGAIASALVMANVAMMNYSYDVPVKLFSTQLFLIAIVLAWLDRRRLVGVFLLNRNAPPADLSPMVRGVGFAIVRNAVKLLLIGALLYSMIDARLETARTRSEGITETPYYGIWEVETFTVDGEEHPPLLTDTERWRYVLVEGPGFAGVRDMQNELSYYGFKVDQDAGTVVMQPAGSQDKSTLTLEEPEPGVLMLEGDLGGKPHRVRLRRIDLDDLEMVNRGYHWISEFPYNRG